MSDPRNQESRIGNITLRSASSTFVIVVGVLAVSFLAIYLAMTGQEFAAVLAILSNLIGAAMGFQYGKAAGTAESAKR